MIRVLPKWLPRHQEGEGQPEPRICLKSKSAYWNVPKNARRVAIQADPESRGHSVRKRVMG